MRGFAREEQQLKEVCSVEGCERAVHSRGWCQKHYAKWDKYGNPTAGVERDERNRNTGQECRIGDCGNPAITRGWCQKHYNRFRKHGDPEMVKVPKHDGQEACQFEGCNSVQKARGFCPGHYSVVRSSADYEHMLPEEARAERCLAPECQNPQYIGGICHTHNAHWRRKGEAWAREGDVVLPDPPTVGGRITLERIRQGLTLRDLAERVGLSHQSVKQSEQGDSMRLSNIAVYADALGVPVDNLLAGVDMSELVRQPKKGAVGRPTTKSLTHRIERLEAAISNGHPSSD